MTAAAALIALDALADGAFAEVEALVDGDAESLVLYRDGAQVRAFLICPHAGRRLDWAPGQFLKEPRGASGLRHARLVRAGQWRLHRRPCKGDRLRARCRWLYATGRFTWLEANWGRIRFP